MDNAIYESMISAKQLLEKQNIISNNLANISTTGFKEKFIFFIQKQYSDYANTNKNIFKEYYNISPGTLNYTNRNLDLFIKDNGWLAVKDQHGQEGYTKNGHLNINENGKLTVLNNEVVGHHCSITIPSDLTIKILSNGVIQSIKNYHKHVVKNTIGALKLVHLPDQDLIQKENGLFYLRNNSKQNEYTNSIKHDNNIRVQPGMLEESNVNSAQNMIEMISNARQFEMQMKMISSCDQNTEYANQLINIHNS